MRSLDITHFTIILKIGNTPMNTIGGVIIESHVEIGASSTIDAGVSSYTTIGEGTKIDNLVQIGHDTVIGINCIIASGTGIAGCVTIKNNVSIWGQVGCASKVTINDNVVVLAQSGISKDQRKENILRITLCRGKTEIQRISSFKKPAKVIQKIIMYTTREQDLVYQNEVKEIKLLSLLEITNAINENAPVKHLMKIFTFILKEQLGFSKFVIAHEPKRMGKSCKNWI